MQAPGWSTPRRNLRLSLTEIVTFTSPISVASLSPDRGMRDIVTTYFNNPFNTTIVVTLAEPQFANEVNSIPPDCLWHLIRPDTVFGSYRLHRLSESLIQPVPQHEIQSVLWQVWASRIFEALENVLALIPEEEAQAIIDFFCEFVTIRHPL